MGMRLKGGYFSMITEEVKLQIINSGKTYFRKIIIPSHLKNLQALKLQDFK